MSIIDAPAPREFDLEHDSGLHTRGAMPELCRDELLHEIFEAQAALTPDNIAVIDGSRQITYAELDRRSTCLAHELQSRGIGGGSFVGILIGRSIEAYVAILGCLKSGAAYVPLDPDYPADRITFILNDCGVSLLLTTGPLANQHAGFAGWNGGILNVEIEVSDRVRLSQPPYSDETSTSVLHPHSPPTPSPPTPLPRRGEGSRRRCWSSPGHAGLTLRDKRTTRLSRDDTQLTPGDLCYVIYTSGSTGKPKGVEIEHRSAAHLVRAEQWLFGVQADDRVYQGFSLAFDASVEEVWLALASGAALVVATREMSQAGPALSGLLTAAGVTVVSCVPTLLSMLSDDIPTVRLLILGGEACPQSLVQRWCRPGRRMFNTYGPTEATVIATFAECHPARAITIGRPLPNYTAHILDEKLNPVAEGQTGELYLGGVGLARGYVGRPDLTCERFIVVEDVDGVPGLGDEGPRRLYKTGDLARIDDDGNLEFLGRADLQVKLRGFRVELSEVEAALLKCDGVQASACAVHEISAGLSHLVAYVVPHNGDSIVPERIRHRLRTELPAYMVPTVIERIVDLPTLPSGKVDRKRLPIPNFQQAVPAIDSQPRTETERKLLAVWRTLFAPMAVTIGDDFFLDLGGHSLLAARMTSELRATPQFARLSMADIYSSPTIEKLAAKFPVETTKLAVRDATGQAEVATDSVETNREPVSAVRHAVCGLAQAVGLYFILGVFALQWLAPYLCYTWMMDEDYPFTEALLGALGSLVVVYPAMLALAVVVKWCVLGRCRPGSYPLWGQFYFRWWLARAVVSIVPINYLAGTPLLGLFYRLMGARIGANVHLAAHNATAFDLLSIDDDTSVGIDASLLAHTVRDGRLILQPITIGKRCFAGNRAIVAGGARMSDGARLEDLSLLPAGQSIPAGETWRGSPARPMADSPVSDFQAAACERPSWIRRFAFGVLHAVSALVVPVFVICAIFPGMMLMHYLNLIDEYYYYLVLAPLVAVSFVVFLCLEIALFKWLVLGRVRAGRYAVFSGFYWRKRFVDLTLDLSLDVLGPLYSTIYLTPWYRLLGAKLGKRAEISTASFISPDLLSIDDEGFIADCVSLGAGRVEANMLTIGPIHVGRRSFIGNSAVLPPGTKVGDNCLLGCLSAPPAHGQAERDGTSWLGSPGFLLPQRQTTAGFSEETTFSPNRWLRLQRAVIEFCRVIGPSTGFISLTSVLLSAVILMRDSWGDAHWLLWFPLLYAGCGLAACAAVIALKWILLGKFRAGEKPLWSTFVWRNELITALHENLTDLFLVDKLKGTPFIAWFFRLLGAKIGKRAFLDTTCFNEYDLVDIGDDVALNDEATVQTHLFEDRVMKMSKVHIGDRCSVGALSLVLYDTTMHAGSELGDLSLLMKNEQLPAGTQWEGIPARRK